MLGLDGIWLYWYEGRRKERKKGRKKLNQWSRQSNKQ
jgi:hypothetical protein